MSFDRLIERIIELKNPTVVGLDPKLEYVPEYIQRRYLDDDGWTMKAAAKAIYAFNQAIIDEIHDVVPAIKPQAAYYEMYGHYGIKALERTIRYAKLNGMFVMTDGKRNDIGATMEAYTNAHLGVTMIGENEVEAFGADALTVNGYLGTDGIEPLLKVCRERDKGIFVLVKTSNPSSGELQDMKLADGRTIYEAMGDMCGARIQEESTATPQSEQLSEQLTPKCSQSSERDFLTRCSLFPATAHRAAEQKVSRAASIRTVSALSLIPPVQ